nr:hypothetical protein [Actinomycetota bacterium]
MTPARRLYARIRALDPLRRDLLVGAVAIVEMQVEALFVPADRVAVHLCVLVLGVCLAVRRRFPLTTFVVAMVPFVVVQALGQAVTESLYLPLFVAIFMAYSVAANSGSRLWWIAPPLGFLAGILAA